MAKEDVWPFSSLCIKLKQDSLTNCMCVHVCVCAHMCT